MSRAASSPTVSTDAERLSTLAESVLRATAYRLPLMLAIIGNPRRFVPSVELYHCALAEHDAPALPVGVLQSSPIVFSLWCCAYSVAATLVVPSGSSR